jgi:signal transduction histidine kinase
MNNDITAELASLKQLHKENKMLKRKLHALEETVSVTEQSYAFQKNICEMIKKQKGEQDVYLDLVFQYTGDVILIIDNNYRLVKATEGSLARLGIVVDLEKEIEVFDVFAPFAPVSQNEQTRSQITEVMTQGMVRSFSHEKMKFGDKSYIFEVNIVPLHGDSGDIIGVMMSLHDITDLHNALETAERASRAKSNFLAKVSHEIRTPMNAILGLSELVLREELPKEPHEHVVGIKQAGAHLVSIINDILDFSKIESGMMEIVPCDYTLSSLLDYVIGIIRMKVIDLPILFTVNVNPALPEHLFGDEMRVKQMILNLLSNATKYCEKGFINFTVEYEVIDGETIMLHMEVADSGIGIRKENIGRLFGDFVQLGEAVGAKEVEGTGLGLAITRGFAVAMGGNISVTSEYGVGSAFKISIPQKLNAEKARPFARVDDESKNVNTLLYETRESYSCSLVSSISSLGISYRLVTDQFSFVEKIEDESEQWDFVFVSSFSYDSAKKSLRKAGRETNLILIAEYGELSITNESTKTLFMPAHSADIACLFNNNSRDEQRDKKRGAQFIAPTARALIVDDINTNLMVAQGLLSPYKIAVDLCISGKEAIELVKSNEYDIVFMDHMMCLKWTESRLLRGFVSGKNPRRESRGCRSLRSLPMRFRVCARCLLKTALTISSPSRLMSLFLIPFSKNGCPRASSRAILLPRLLRGILLLLLLRAWTSKTEST